MKLATLLCLVVAVLSNEEEGDAELRAIVEEHCGTVTDSVWTELKDSVTACSHRADPYYRQLRQKLKEDCQALEGDARTNCVQNDVKQHVDETDSAMRDTVLGCMSRHLSRSASDDTKAMFDCGQHVYAEMPTTDEEWKAINEYWEKQLQENE